MTEIEIIYPGEQVRMNPASSAFAHGFGIFETIRVAKGSLYFWEAHWRRLLRSAEALGLALDPNDAPVLSAIKTLFQSSDQEEMTIKLSLVEAGADARLLVYSRPAFTLPPVVRLLLGYPGRLNGRSPLAGHKTHNYMENRLLMEAARKAGCYDVLRLNHQGRVAEGAIANIFWIKAERLYTPSLDCGLLPGVVRECLLHHLEVDTGPFDLDAVLGADGVFLTNASVGLLPVEEFLHHGEREPCPCPQAESLEKIRQHYQTWAEAAALPL